MSLIVPGVDAVHSLPYLVQVHRDFTHVFGAVRRAIIGHRVVSEVHERANELSRECVVQTTYTTRGV